MSLVHESKRGEFERSRNVQQVLFDNRVMNSKSNTGWLQRLFVVFEISEKLATKLQTGVIHNII